MIAEIDRARDADTMGGSSSLAHGVPRAGSYVQWTGSMAVSRRR